MNGTMRVDYFEQAKIDNTSTNSDATCSSGVDYISYSDESHKLREIKKIKKQYTTKTKLMIWQMCMLIV